MGSLAGFAEQELGAPGHHVIAVVDKRLKKFFDIEGFGAAVDEGDVVDAERSLHLCHLVEFVEHNVGVGVRLEFDDNTHALVVRFVIDVGDAIEFLFVDKVGYIFNEFRLVDAIRDLVDDYRLVVGFCLDFGLGSDDDASAACLVCFFDAVVAVDRTACREVWCGDVLHELGDCDVRILKNCYRGVDRFGHVVGRHVCCHADGYTCRSVDQKVGKTAREYDRLHFGIVIVGLEIYCVAVDVCKHFLADFR